MIKPPATIAVYRGLSDSDQPNYRAVAGDISSEGDTIGQAIDALTNRLGQIDFKYIFVESTAPDRFFNAQQQERLSELMTRHRNAKFNGEQFPVNEFRELEGLLNDQIRGTGERLKALTETTPT